MMDDETVLQHFRETGALMEGHFILSSGLRSPLYLQCARVLMHPERAEVLCRALAEKVRETLGMSPQAVVSPAMGGIVVGYETARQLAVPAMFTERVDGRFAFRRGFAVEPGCRILMVEDVITTGLSSRECIETIGEAGGEVIAAACLIDRSNGTADVGVPLISLVQLDVPTYAPEEVPADMAAIPAVKPGSRGTTA